MSAKNKLGKEPAMATEIQALTQAESPHRY